jgi:hemerythrin superfamily protein
MATKKSSSRSTSKRSGSGSRAGKSTGASSRSRSASSGGGARSASGSGAGARKSASSARGAAAKRTTSSRSTTTKRASSARGSASRPPNAIELLKTDHATVRELLSRLEQTTSRGDKTRTELLARIQRELEAHTVIEEEIFYPAFKEAGERQDDDKLYFEALEEHRAAGELVLPDLLQTDPSSECFGGRAKVLKELVEHHAREEEREMFPRARQLLSVAELRELGERMQARKQALLAQPAPPKSIAGRVLAAVGSVLPATAREEDGEDDESEASGRTGAKGRRDGADGSRAPRNPAR